jgi:hypothetical protein
LFLGVRDDPEYYTLCPATQIMGKGQIWERVRVRERKINLMKAGK